MKSGLALSLIAILFFLLACSQPESDSPAGIQIKVLIAYSSDDSDRFNDYPGKIRELFAETQSVFTNSGTQVDLEIAAISRIRFTPEERLIDLERLVKKKDGYWDTIHELRDKAEADIVVLVSPLANATVNASTLATEATSFVIVAWEHFEAPTFGLAHEISHLFGSMHPGTIGPVADQFPQGFPWGNDSIKTVIDWSAGRTLPYFSSPAIFHQGIPLGEAGKSDIASVIRTTAAYISNFRGKATNTDFVPQGTIPTLDFSE